MRMSRLFSRTRREDPGDAEAGSHRLLVRAGYVRRVAAGVYSWLPLGRRVLGKVEQIVREEVGAAGAQEVVLPTVQPLDLWERTGRDAEYGPLMFRLVDRKGTGLCLAPTAEEVVTATVAGEYTSHRDLPVNLYQIGWKYRDELRPRFGLLRAREFLMMDAYSFDADRSGLAASYRAMFDAYRRVFDRCGLEVRAVLAEPGEMGGDVSHEHMAPAAVGEDEFVWCPKCDYAANVEAATRRGPETAERGGVDVPPMETVHTPGLPGIAGVAELLGVERAAMLKCIVFEVTGDEKALGLALVPGDREVNAHHLARAVAPRRARVLDEADLETRPDLPVGYIGPNLAEAGLVVADPAVRAANGWVTGANRPDHHVRHALLDRDFQVHEWADLASVVRGDPCPRCGEPLSIDLGIEVGHTFQLGTRYSDALGAAYTDPAGVRHPMVMGCYGIGVSRIVAAVAEQHGDDLGLVWPATVSPFDVHLIALRGHRDEASEVAEAAERLYTDLAAAGRDVLYDDRDASPGVKFADADLIGVPVQLVVGRRGLARGVVERKERASGARRDLALPDASQARI